MREVNTYITYTRADIPHDISGIAILLAQHDWALSISGVTHVDTLGRHLISAETARWAGLRIGGYAVGYYAQSGDEKSIINSARKLAELCLRLRETFPEHLPQQEIDDRGYITEDTEGTLKIKEGALPLLHYLSSLRGEPKDSPYPEFSRGFIRFKSDQGELLLSAQEITDIKGAIHAAECR